MPTKLIGTAGLVATALLVAACGGSEDASTTTTTTAAAAATSTTIAGDIDSVTAALMSALMPEDGTSGPLTTDEAACASQGMVEAIGLDRTAELLNSAVYTYPGDPTPVFAMMTADEMPLAVDAVEGCIDYEAAASGTLVYFGFTAEVSDCLSASLLADGYGRTLLETFLAGSDPALADGFTASYLDGLSLDCPTATHALITDDLTSYYGVSAESGTCVADAFQAHANYRSILSLWMGVPEDTLDTDAVSDEITDVLAGCLTADEMTMLGIETTTTSSATTTTTEG